MASKRDNINIHDWYMMYQPNTSDVRNKISVLEGIKDLRYIMLV